MEWKDKFVIGTFLVIIVVIAIMVFTSLDNKNQPSVEDVMTNSSSSIYDFME